MSSRSCRKRRSAATADFWPESTRDRLRCPCRSSRSRERSRPVIASRLFPPPLSIRGSRRKIVPQKRTARSTRRQSVIRRVTRDSTDRYSRGYHKKKKSTRETPYFRRMLLKLRGRHAVTINNTVTRASECLKSFRVIKTI